MILAAGEGRRLRPITESVPKALVEVGGRPLIDYPIETLVRAGIRELVVNLHHLGSQIRQYLGDGSRYGVNVSYSAEDPLLDSGGGIAQARPLLKGDTFVTLNADTIVDIDLRAAIAFHDNNRAMATMVLRADSRAQEYGAIGVDNAGRIERFLEHVRPDSDSTPRGHLDMLMYTGVQVLDPQVFNYMDQAGPFSITKNTYPAMLAAGELPIASGFKTWVTYPDGILSW